MTTAPARRSRRTDSARLGDDRGPTHGDLPTRLIGLGLVVLAVAVAIMWAVSGQQLAGHAGLAAAVSATCVLAVVSVFVGVGVLIAADTRRFAAIAAASARRGDGSSAVAAIGTAAVVPSPRHASSSVYAHRGANRV